MGVTWSKIFRRGDFFSFFFFFFFFLLVLLEFSVASKYSPLPTMILLTKQFSLLLWCLGPILDVYCRNRDPWKAKNRSDTRDFASATNIFNPMKIFPTLISFFDTKI